MSAKSPEMIRPDLYALPQIRDRMTFIYLEQCQISRDNSAIQVVEERGLSQIFLIYKKHSM